MKALFFMLMILGYTTFTNDVEIPDYYTTDEDLTESLQAMVNELELNKDFNVGEDGIEQISLTVVDLNSPKPILAGVNVENFVYPASVYKIYIAAEVLNQISQGKYSLDSMVVVKSPNDVDKSKEIETDPRPLLKDGDVVSVNYLLDLMITRSDNSASNMLIDLAQRENINRLIEQYNWRGSEVTRKFLSRKFEDPGYKDIRGTETSSLHAADFMYLVENNKLVNPWVSMQMKALLGRQLDRTKYSRGLPSSAMFYHKTGWFAYWTNDVGIVQDGNLKYVVAVLLPLQEDGARPKYELLSSKIHEVMKGRYQNNHKN
ncbi:MAG: serine hydrolase [Balneolaceae bacterium]